jgi:hypothetical protein
MTKLYVYLAARNKKGMRLITVLHSTQNTFSKIIDVKSLQLPAIWEQHISKIAYENRMAYELWAQSSSSYIQLRKSLVARGYTNIPMGASPMLNLSTGKIPTANTSSCDVIRTMLRKRAK